MSPRRPLLGLLAVGLAAVVLVPLSGAAFTTSSTSAGRVTASPDWTPPAVSVSGGATGLVRGTVELAATASDAESSVASVRLEVRPAGSTAAWSALCTDTTSPYSCAWATTTTADGDYDVRAVATDAFGNVGTSAVVRRTVDNLGPVVAVDEEALPDYLRGTVTVRALASDAGGISSVRIQRSTNGTSWTDLCTTSTSPYQCSWTTSGSGDAFLRAIATDVSGNSTTSAVALVTLDNTPPTVSVASPGSTVSGVVTVTATAGDAESGVASVLVERREGSGAWASLCTATTSPYSCRWDTTVHANGSTHAFRATATDLAGNVTVSSTTSASTVDNTKASVSLEDPGAFLRGTVPLLANASAPGGVASVAVQYAPAGTTTWTTICTDTTSPYGCDWDTTKVAGGSYGLRAVMTPVSGSVLVSAVVAQRVVDNAPLRGVDVQAVNGGTALRVDAGDVLTFTYDSRVNLGSVVAGWTGEARSVGVRLRDGTAVAGGVGGEDLLDVLTGTGSTTTVALGAVNTRGNYVKGQAMVFAGTMTADTVTVNGQPATRVTVVLGALTTADNGRTFRSARTMSWTPSAAARDLAGNPASTTPVAETGALDRDF